MSRHCLPNLVDVKMMGCLQRSWNKEACSKLIWPNKDDKRSYDDFGAEVRYIYTALLGSFPYYINILGWNRKEKGT